MGDVDQVRHRSPADVFVGRDDALAVMDASASDAEHGRPWVVIVEGPAGVGKSAFVRRATATLSGFTVLRASADELAIDESMWLLAQLLGGQLSSAPFAAAMELLAVVADAQTDGPVAVVVEDLQWADEQSRRALLTALRRLEGDRVLAVVTTRPSSRPDDEAWVRFADDVERCRRITLGPLSPAEVASVADRLEVPLGPNAATRLQRHTDGLALHVRTLLRELTSAQLNAFGALPAPRSLAQTTISRVDALPARSIELLRALAVVGRPATLVELGRVAGAGDPTAALEEALVCGFVERSSRETGAVVRFVHPLYAAAIYDDIPPVRRRQLHLAAAGVDRRSSLKHRVAAIDRPDEQLAVELEQAASNSTDPSTAGHLLVAAADVSEQPATAASRLLAAGRHHLAAGDVHRLIQLRTRLEDLFPSAERNVLLGWIAWQRGDLEDAERVLRSAAAGAQTVQDRVPALLHLGSLYAFQSRGAAAIEAGQDLLATDDVDPEQVELAWRMIAAGTNQAAGGAAALDVLTERYSTAHADPAELDPVVQRAFALFENCAGRPADALVWFDRVMPRARTGELAGQLAHIHMIRAQCHYRVGQWDEALVHAHTAIDLANDEEQTWVLGHVNAVTSWLHAGRGQWDLAERRLEQARAGAAAVPLAGAVILTRVADGFLARARDRPDDVVRHLAPLTTDGGIPTPASSNLSYWPILINALVDLRRFDDAHDELHRLRDAADARRIDLQMQLLAIDARLLAARGDATGATQAFEAAIDAIDGQSDVLDQITVRHTFGRHLRAVGRRRDALFHLSAAHSLATSVGAAPYAERIHVDLPRSEATSAPARIGQLSILSPRERDVVTLLVGGATNREAASSLYVSVKAIEYHVGNVYAKLHINSRRELKALVTAAV